MAQFEELQELWQQQPQSPLTRHDAESLTTDLRRFGRRQDLINGLKVLALIGQIVFVVIRTRHDPMRMVGVSLIDLCVVYFLAWEWRRQRAAARLDFTASSVAFLKTSIARLQALKNPFRGREALILMGGCMVGFNLMLHGTHWGKRVSFTALPLAIYFPSVYLRAKRWDHECGPLVERLKALVAAAEEKGAWIQH
jgi:hypothetical protein